MIIPEQPDQILFLIKLAVPLFASFGIGIFIGLKYDRIVLSTVFIVVSLACTFGVVFIDDEFGKWQEEIKELIKTGPCDELIQIARAYEQYTDEVADEIVIRCLQDNPELVDFVERNT